MKLVKSDLRTTMSKPLLSFTLQLAVEAVEAMESTAQMEGLALLEASCMTTFHLPWTHLHAALQGVFQSKRSRRAWVQLLIAVAFGDFWACLPLLKLRNYLLLMDMATWCCVICALNRGLDCLKIEIKIHPYLLGRISHNINREVFQTDGYVI